MKSALILLGLLWSGGVFAAAPPWAVNPVDFEQSVAVTAVLAADFQPVAGPDNLLAAFAGAELRGVAAPVEVLGQWIYFLTVYADQGGETLQFKAYLAAEDAVFDVRETLVFQANATYGDPTSPLALNAIVAFDFPPVWSPIADQVIEVGQSFQAIDLDDHLQSEDGDPVRFSVSGPDFAPPRLSVNVGAGNVVSIAPPGPGWTGSETLVFTAVEETANRLTALAQATFSVRQPDRAPQIAPIPDQTIRQYRTFAPFDLDDYLTELDGDAVAWSLSFPFTGLGTGLPGWSVAAASFEQTMSVTAAVALRGQKPGAGNSRLAAFVHDPSQPNGLGAVRGVASPVVVGQQTLYFLTVYADQGGEQMVFRYYDAQSDQVYQVKERLTFAANALHGDPQNPLLLRAGALSYALDGDNVVAVEVLDPAFTGSEAVRFTAADQGTAKGLKATVEVNFTVEAAQTIYGDVTGDGQVMAEDAEWIMEHVVGSRVLGGLDATLADVSGDGRISPFDARLVRQFVAGLISQFPVEAGGGN
jgi:hypothetical protein